MHPRFHLLVFTTFSLCLSACELQDPGSTEEDRAPASGTMTEAVGSTDQQTDASAPPSLPAAQHFETIEWTDLMPDEDLQALLNPPEYLNEIEDGSLADQLASQLGNNPVAGANAIEDASFEDQISSQIENSIAAAGDDRYQQALQSTNIRAEFNGKAVRLPGFVVPLEFDDQQSITQFFLVPYFGACIHVPPPPPNQIIFVSHPQGLKQNNLYDPYWISGVLSTKMINNEMATAAYSMQLHSYEAYTE